MNGTGARQPIPDFSDGCTGRAPDIGARRCGAPSINTASPPLTEEDF
jgi:hypothetical protein